MRRILAFTLAAFAIAACGGAVEQPTGNAPAPESKLKSANADVQPFGVWDLVSLDRDDTVPTEVHDILQLDLKADGSVTARRCGKPYYETVAASVRCGDEASYDCFYGTVTREADGSWRVNLPDLPMSDSRDERTIETVQAGETIKIHYIMPKSSAGLFQRAEDGIRQSSSSYTVGNCKAGG